MFCQYVIRKCSIDNSSISSACSRLPPSEDSLCHIREGLDRWRQLYEIGDLTSKKYFSLLKNKTFYNDETGPNFFRAYFIEILHIFHII